MFDALDAIAGSFGVPALIFAFAVMFVAGFTKGAVGFALPMIAISGIGSVLSAPLAIAALIVPSVVTNVWQTFRQGRSAAWRTLREFWLLNLVLFAMIALCAQLVVTLSEQALFLILGVGVTTFGTVQLLGWKPPSPDGFRKPVEIGVGLIAGFFGGLSGVWGPPILLYLVSLDTPKTEMVRAQGVSFLLGAIILTGAHLRSGLLLGTGGPLSVWMILPAVAGMAVGLAVQDRLDQRLFRRATLVVLVLAGLNLLRRGLA